MTMFVQANECNCCVQTDTLCDMGMIEQLMNLLRCEQAPYHEHLVRALVNLVTDHPRSLEECQCPQHALKDLLSQLMTDLQGKPEYLVSVTVNKLFIYHYVVLIIVNVLDNFMFRISWILIPLVLVYFIQSLLCLLNTIIVSLVSAQKLCI